MLDQWFGLDGDTDASDAIAATLHGMYTATDLTDSEKRMALLEVDRETLEASDDPFVKLAVAMYQTNLTLEAEDEALEGQLLEARPRFMEALLAFQKSRDVEIYPDANGTPCVFFDSVEKGLTERLRFTCHDCTPFI